MKRILSGLLITVLFVSCLRKEEDIPMPKLTISEKVVSIGFDRITLSCNVNGNMTVESLHFEYSRTPEFTESKKAQFTKVGDSFTIILMGLERQTTYYYRYTAINRISSFTLDNCKSFITRNGQISFDSLTISNIFPNSAEVSVTIKDDCGGPITERGFCYSTSPNPSVLNNIVTVSSSSNTYSGTLSSLSPATLYYVCAYSKNDTGIYYSDSVQFTTSSGNITFDTPSISNIQPQSATVSVTIRDTGGSTVTERGFCYSTLPNPTVANSKLTISSSSNTYSGTLSSLIPSTKYYVRAYAKNAFRAYYSSQTEFTTAAEEKYVEFGDQTFKTYCLNNFDINGDGRISYSEAEMVTKIDVCSYHYQGRGQIQTLAGVEHFSQLIELNCDNNQITELNLGNLQKLQKLYCNDNELASLDVSLLTDLKVLECGNARHGYGNNHLSALEVSNNLQLEELFCNGNRLTELSLDSNTKLKVLSCSNNKLSSLNISMLVDLEELDCGNFIINGVDYNGTNRLSKLDVSSNKKLLRLYLGGGVCRFSTIDVSNNIRLESLDVYGGYITALNLNKNTQLTYLCCDYNRLTTLDLSKNTQLRSLSCKNNQLTTLDVSKHTQLIYLYCYSNQLTELDVSNNTRLVYLYCYDNPGLTVWLGNNQSINYFEYGNSTIRYK